MVKVSCSGCNKEYDVDSSFEGKKVKCSGCDNIFIVSFNDEKNKEEVKQKVEEKIEKKKIDKEDDLNIKPNKKSFFILGKPDLLLFIILMLIGFVINILVGVIFLEVIGFVINILVGVIFLVIITILYFWINIVYKKEEYILTDRKIIYNYGNLFSDNSIEINLDKITQVSSILGFIQYKLFGTGTLVIKTAGSSNSKIKLKNIDGTMDLYENIQKRMKKNGFHLQKDKLVQTAKPHWLGIVGEIFGKIVANFFIIFVFIGGALENLSKELPIGGLVDYSLIPLILFLIITGFIIIISYLDLKRRKYEVFTDSIFYTEGFLTKNFSFLPMESVADTENTQSFFSKIFGLHDITVSSEGSNNNVIFKNMTEGEQLMKNIKYLKDNIIMGEKDILEGEDKKANSLIGFKDKIEKPLDYDKEYKAEFKISILKSIIITLPFIFLPPFFIILLILQLIKVHCTKFKVETSSIEKEFDFLSKKHNSFSVEKITGVFIKESILDRILGTCSISFWSIGSSSNITFSNIKKTPDLEKNILAKVGIKIKEEFKDIPVNFNLINFLKSSIGNSIGFLIALLPLIPIAIFTGKDGFVLMLILFIIFGLIFGIFYLYKIFYYKKSRYIQRLHNDFIESISGIIYVRKYYSLFRHVKGIKSIKYPLTPAGKLIINIAGEQVQMQKFESKNKKKRSIVSNSIKIPFVNKVFDIHNVLDENLKGEKIDSTLIKESKQDIGNSILGLILFLPFLLLLALPAGIISIISLIILFGILIGYIIWSIKVKYYNFEKDRVLFGSGIIYKKKQTILYDKFNFIEKNQGFINKIFKNGIVKIYTLGSGKIEMKIKDVDNYLDIYNLLKKD